jgi:hypothetical protein
MIGKLLTSWNRIIEKLIVAYLVNKFPVFYGIRKFTTMFSRAHHWSLSWLTWTQCTFPSYFPNIHSNIIIPSTPRCFEFLLSFSFPTKFLNSFLICPMRAKYLAKIIGKYLPINEVQRYLNIQKHIWSGGNTIVTLSWLQMFWHSILVVQLLTFVPQSQT